MIDSNAAAVAALELSLLVAIGVVALVKVLVAFIGTVVVLIAHQIDVNALQLIFALELFCRARCCGRPCWYNKGDR